MKLYTESQIKDLLETQKGNCYVAILSAVKNDTVASVAMTAPLPGGEQFDQFYGIDPESLFMEDIKDRELQRNYERFKGDRESAKISYNACVPTLNEMIKKISNLKELIVTLSMQGLPSNKIVEKLEKLIEDCNAIGEKANQYKEEMDDKDDLIKKYKDWNERKLFMHWKYLTLLKVTEEPWMDWKKQYDDVMI